jgi:HEAT repeat protein
MHWWTLQQLKSRKPETRREAVGKLAAEAAPQAVDVLLPLLCDEAAEVRKGVAVALGRFKDERAVQPLLRALRDTDGEVRQAIVTALMFFGGSVSADCFVGLLKDPHAGVRWQAGKALEALGWQPSSDTQRVLRAVATGQFSTAAGVGAAAIDPLIAAVKDGHSGNRRAAVEALSQMGDDRVLKPLIAALKDADAPVRVAAVEALGSLRELRALEPLAQCLKDRDAQVRATTAVTLGKLGDASIVDRLTAVLKDSNWSVRKGAVEALGQLKAANAIEAIARLLKDPDHDVRETTIHALAQIRDPRAIEPLVVALTDSQTSVRRAAAGTLRLIDREWERSEAAQRAIPELKAALKHKEYWVRQAATEALAQVTQVPATEPQLNAFTDPVHYKHRAAVDALLEALVDHDRDLRQAAAESLGRLGDTRAAALLSGALQDEDVWVRKSAEEALRALQSQSPPLPPSLVDPPKPAGGAWGRAA